MHNPFHIHDYHVTVLNLLGFDNYRFTCRHQGLDHRLTGVVAAHVNPKLIA